MEENIVKTTAKRLGMTYRQLGEAIGYGEEAVSKTARTSEISKPMQKAIELLLTVEDQKEQLKTVEELKSVLKKVLN